jgi:hypothetical protein
MMDQLEGMRPPRNAEGFAGKTAFWFARERDLDLIEPERILVAPIWRTLNRGREPRSLL